MRQIAKAFLGASSPRLNRKDWSVGQGFSSNLRLPKERHTTWLDIAFLILAGLLV
jgi:hypothetical protein